MGRNTSRAAIRKRIWRETTDLLAERGNRIRMMLAILIVAASALPELVLFQILAEIPEQNVTGGNAVLTLVCPVLILAYLIAVLLPMLSGLFRLAERMEAEEETALSEVFCAFSGAKAYRQALTCGVEIGFPILLLTIVPMIVTDALSGFAGESAGRWLLTVLASAAADFAVFYLLQGGFRRPYVAMRTGARTAHRMSRKRSAGVWYWCLFLPHLLLSVLTLLIYFIADILPRMLIFYFRFCREVLMIPEERQS